MKPEINRHNLFLPGKAFTWRSMEAVGTRSARSPAATKTCSILDCDVTPVKLPTAPGNMGSAVVPGMKVNMNLNSNMKPEISTEKGAYNGKAKGAGEARNQRGSSGEGSHRCSGGTGIFSSRCPLLLVSSAAIGTKILSAFVS
jgi:hypothetical protein